MKRYLASSRLASHLPRVPCGAVGQVARPACANSAARPLRSHRYASTSLGSDNATTATLESNESNDLQIQSTDLLDVYNSLVARGILKWDAEQVRCVMELRKLLEELQDYSPPLDLLAKLSPDAPLLARAAKRSSSSWWKGMSGSKEASTAGLGPGEKETALIRVLSGEEELTELTTPKGILLIGPPGTGKSYLLSLFFSLLPTRHKARHHYHPFLLSLYQAVWRRTQARMASSNTEIKEANMDKVGKEGWRAIFAGGAYEGDGEEADSHRISKTGMEERESIAFGIARDMIMEYHVLYFDELQLVDASSASLMRDILSFYWRLGGVIVATSNRLPDDLYHHGVQRERMANFLEALKSRCTVHEVNGGRDWRLGVEDSKEQGELPDTFTSWYRAEDRAQFELAVKEATGGVKGHPSSVNVYGRRVPVPWATEKACRFTFAELCEEALGTADYITLASRFELFIIDEMPLLYLRHKNQARRLINLVDALYESRCKIIVSAEAVPEDIFFPDAVEVAADDNDAIMAAEALSDAVAAPFRPNVSAYQEQGDAGRMMKRKGKPAHPSEETTAAFKSLSIFTGEDERFAYKRAVSRLIEMSRSSRYATEQWLPLADSQRRWEKLALSVPPPTPSYLREARERVATTAKYPKERLRQTLGRPDETSSDFADEAGYSRSVLAGDKPRGPPVISESHVWGVREEWGPKAGEWGKGVKGSKSGKDGK